VGAEIYERRRTMGDTLTVTMSRDDLRKLLAESGSHELRVAVTEAQAGEPLDDLLFTEWSQCWPVIDSDLVLTGAFTDSDDTHTWFNYDDRAAIYEGEARDAGWNCPEEDETSGYASPPVDTDDD
jgi:hypothetical protein